MTLYLVQVNSYSVMELLKSAQNFGGKITSLSPHWADVQSSGGKSMKLKL